MSKSAKKNEKIDRLTMWEWDTLVAAWRYYEHGHTITSANFPNDIVERFWGPGNPYSDEVRDMIARQFAKVDHGLRGESDWTKGVACDCDVEAWVTFYQFCKGWCDGYFTVTAREGDKEYRCKAFHLDYSDRWIVLDKYIEKPHCKWYVANEFIVKTEKETKEHDGL